MKKITIEGTYTTPNAVFHDTFVKIGRSKYPYEEITDVRSVSAPAKLVNGLVQLSLRSGEVLHVTYFLKDTEKMRQALQIVMPYVRKNKEKVTFSAAVTVRTRAEISALPMSFSNSHSCATRATFHRMNTNCSKPV